jgi:hypothetical protein
MLSRGSGCRRPRQPACKVPLIPAVGSSDGCPALGPTAMKVVPIRQELPGPVSDDAYRLSPEAWLEQGYSTRSRACRRHDRAPACCRRLEEAGQDRDRGAWPLCRYSGASARGSSRCSGQATCQAQAGCCSGGLTAHSQEPWPQGQDDGWRFGSRLLTNRKERVRGSVDSLASALVRRGRSY